MEVTANHQRLFADLEKRAASPDDLNEYVKRAIDRL
jgi:hypothetical protein